MATWQKLLLEFLAMGIIVFLVAYFLMSVSMQESLLFTGIILLINGVYKGIDYSNIRKVKADDQEDTKK